MDVLDEVAERVDGLAGLKAEVEPIPDLEGFEPGLDGLEPVPGLDGLELTPDREGLESIPGLDGLELTPDLEGLGSIPGLDGLDEPAPGLACGLREEGLEAPL